MSSSSSPPSRDSSSTPIPEGDSLPPSRSQEEDQPRRPRRSRPKDFPESQASKLWKALENPTGGPVNEVPGGKFNSAGGKPREPTWRDAFRWDQFKNQNRPPWYKTGCARDSLLVGMGAGGAVFGVRFMVRGGRGMLWTSNYAVGAFAVTAVGMHVWCAARMKEEAKGIAAAVTGMKMLNDKRVREDEERRRMETERLERQRREEEERRRSKSWYKWW